MSQVTDYFCHLCRNGHVRRVPGFEDLRRVTSDCRPWPAGGTLGVCTACGTVQKLIDQSWRDEAGAIYAQYDMYYQAINGVEQAVFDQKSGKAVPRSQRILGSVGPAANFPAVGRMIDVGCGNGAMLRAFSALMPKWELNGLEPNINDPGVVLDIPGVNKVFDCDLMDVPGEFDLISMIHVLEHIENPVPLLAKVGKKLRPDGCLLVEVPYFPDNPYDLVIADHCTHFTVATLTKLLVAAGLEVITITTDIVAKEITAISRCAATANVLHQDVLRADRVEGAWRAVEVAVNWLRQVMNDAQSVAQLGNFGLFGTSISANWLVGAVQGQIRFFVDEDPGRIGTTFQGCPVLHPRNAPSGSHIYMVLPRELAERIVARLEPNGVEFHLPPPYQNYLEDAPPRIMGRRRLEQRA